MNFNKNLICEMSGGNSINFYDHFVNTDSTPRVWEQSGTQALLEHVLVFSCA